jgi:seryl-tRNA synthetase
MRAEQKSLGKSVSKAQGDEKAALLQRAKDLAAQVKSAEAEAEKLAGELDELLQTVPNIVEEGAPPGGEDDYVVLETHGEPRVSLP